MACRGSRTNITEHAQKDATGATGKTQIMEAPPGHPGELIEPTLGMSEVLEGLV
jgi:hypothetical protein